MHKEFWVPVLIITLLMVGCSTTVEVGNENIDNNHVSRDIEKDKDLANEEITNEKISIDEELVDIDTLRMQMIEKYKGMIPTQWGEKVDGVVTKINTEEKIIALTFDACGGGIGNAYDEELIAFLIEENVPATLFISGQWIDHNQEALVQLAGNPLFEIANHGYNHKPLSVKGKEAYAIKGTANVEAAFNEVYKNQQKIYQLTGKEPVYFRSGTAYYDEIAVQLVNDMGLKVINYNVLGDAGATFSKEQIVKSMLSSESGAIILFHMNRPDKPIAEGVKMGVFKLREDGYIFVHLNEYENLFYEN